MTTPKEKISIEIKGSVIELNVPSVGQFIDIEKKKIQLTNDTHKSMLFARTKSSVTAYTFAEMVATFEVLIPNLQDRLNKRSITDLNPVEIKELLKIYTKEVFPWIQSWQDYINGEEKEDQAQED